MRVIGHPRCKTTAPTPPSFQIHVSKAVADKRAVGEAFQAFARQDHAVRIGAHSLPQKYQPEKMTRRALIVDDEPATCQLIRGVLSSSGMDSLSLTKSVEATGYLREEKFDVVVLDFAMPAPNGIELAQQARDSGHNQRTPIIMISDDQRPSAVSEGFDAGANFFLYKPIDTARLLRLIRITQGTVEHDKRRFRRVKVRSRVSLTSDQGDFDCETVDVSLNGMMVNSPKVAPAGSAVRVSLEIPGSAPILAAGSIKRIIGDHQMGIQFDLLRTDESGRLQEFLLPLIIEG
jgi:DNA-binding response OmpR family regulator